jgi:hypothetical protein
MLRALPTASLILLLVVQASGQDLTQTPAQPAKPLTLTQVWTLDATYTDHQHGVTFRYPSAWEATTQFAYHPPALTVSEATRPVTMLQACPHAIHFKRILDFGEGQRKGTSASSCAGIPQTSGKR